MHVEGGADTEHDCEDALAVFCHPPLLLGAPEAHEEDPYPRTLESFDDGIVFVTAQWPERGRPVKGNIEPRKPTWQLGPESIDYLGAASVKPDRDTVRGGGFADAPHQVGASDAGCPAKPERPLHPDHRHAVRAGEVGVGEDFAEDRGIMGFHEHVSIREADVTRLTTMGPAHDLFGCRSVAGDVDETTDDLGRYRRCEGRHDSSLETADSTGLRGARGRQSKLAQV